MWPDFSSILSVRFNLWTLHATLLHMYNQIPLRYRSQGATTIPATSWYMLTIIGSAHFLPFPYCILLLQYTSQHSSYRYNQTGAFTLDSNAGDKRHCQLLHSSIYIYPDIIRQRVYIYRRHNNTCSSGRQNLFSC